MAVGLGYQLGGIVGLLRFLSEHAGAVEADLIAVGLRLRDVPERMNWRDLAHFIRHASPDSATQRELSGLPWTTTDMLLVVAANSLRTITWQLGGGKSKDRPEPFLLPGMEAAKNQPAPDFNGDVMTVEEFEAWYREMG